MKKALLFINGTPPINFPDLEGYDFVAATDGAFHYLKDKDFPLEKLDLVAGDFDSHDHDEAMLKLALENNIEVIITPDQDFTDFQKLLDILRDKGFEKIDVYGGSGGEQDHFLGNIHAAFLFKNELEITFFDEFSRYFFIDKKFRLENAKGKMISLLPFPFAENVTTKGLNWLLKNENLSITERIGTRNFAKENTIEISYKKGDLLIFIGH